MANIQTYKRKDPKYPLRVKFTRGKKVRNMIVPDQHKFKTAFLRDHGCSIMAEYVALQWLGVTKYKPGTLLKMHRKKTPEAVKAKVTIKGVAQLMGELVPFSFILFRSEPTEKKLKSQLDAGNLVLFEEGDPIHTVVLIRAEGKYWRITNGKCQAVNISAEAKRATKNQTYSGMVIVGSVEG